MKLLATTAVISALAFAAPAQAQLLGSSNSGLLGLANNLLNVQTGHVSVLNGGLLNGSSILSGIGQGNHASAHNSSTNTTGSDHSVASGRGSMVVGGRGNTVVRGNSNVLGTGNVVGNQWGSNFSQRTFNRFGW